jgi:hypothetical protein
MSGYEVLRTLRVAKVKTPILILSGMAGIEDKVKGHKEVRPGSSPPILRRHKRLPRAKRWESDGLPQVLLHKLSIRVEVGNPLNQQGPLPRRVVDAQGGGKVNPGSPSTCLNRRIRWNIGTSADRSWCRGTGIDTRPVHRALSCSVIRQYGTRQEVLPAYSRPAASPFPCYSAFEP